MTKSKKANTRTAVDSTPQPFSIGQSINLSVTSLSYHGGRGVGRADGMVFFVPLTVPGDIVTARITELHKKFGVAQLIEVTSPSAERRAPPCPIANQCGGCSWQQVSYQEQVIQKQQILSQSLRSVESITPINWLPFVSAKDEFRYRNRIQVHKKDAAVGFFARGSHDLISTDDCLITEASVAEKIKDVKSTTPSNGPQRFEIARLQSGDIVVRSADRDPESAYFAQVNNQQNAQLLKMLLSAVENHSWSGIIDLYCGSGNLTFPLIQAYPKARCWGVDLSQSNINTAKRLSLNDKSISPIEWIANPVAQFLKDFETPAQPLLVVLDPPRPGCDGQVISELIKLRPQQILYVSCNPTTFARDAVKLLQSNRYTLKSVQGLDMFPQTEHVELLASFIALQQ